MTQTLENIENWLKGTRKEGFALLLTKHEENYCSVEANVIQHNLSGEVLIAAINFAFNVEEG